MTPNISNALSGLFLAAAITMPTNAVAQPVQIVAIGDSNIAGLFAGRRNAFPAVIEAALKARGYDVSISNRGISGDTTRGMLSRLDSAVPRGTQIAIVQGGYNDGRRGISARARDQNINAILARLNARRVKVVLCGFTGANWAGIARRHTAIIVPPSHCYDANHRGFDGLHMNRQGHRVVGARLTPVVEGLL